jgi:lysophospholipase
MHSPDIMHHTFHSADGLDLYGRSHLAKDPELHVVIQHGLGEHGDRYQKLIERLNDRNISVHLMDLRGHGRSGGRRGDAAGVLQLALDLEAFFAHLKELAILKKPVLLGHSLGGVVAVTFALRHSNQFHLSGLAVSAAPFAVRLNPLQKGKQMAGRIINRFMPDLILDSGLDPAYLSHDRMVVEAYRKDPRVHGKLSIRLGLSILSCGQSLIEQASRLQIPLWAAHGTMDRITDPAGTEQFYLKAAAEEKFLCLYEGLYHEIFNEPDPSPVEDFLEFVEACLIR